MKLHYDPEIPLVGIYPEKPKTLIVHCSVIFSSQDLEVAQVHISGRVDKKAVVHLHSGILFSHYKEGNLLWLGWLSGLSAALRTKRLPV